MLYRQTVSYKPGRCKKEIMSTEIVRQFLYISYFTGVFGITVEPNPLANCQRYDSLILTCSVDKTWRTVGFYLQESDGSENIAFFTNSADPCKNVAAPTPGLYQTNCDNSSYRFFITIKNVTDTYHGKFVECIMEPESQRNRTIINVQYAPTSSPRITQIPKENVIENSKVTLTCRIFGGNPLASIVWQCTGFLNATPTVTPPANETVSSIERFVTKDDNDKECICKGKHLLWGDDQEDRHTLKVYYQPTTPLSIIQTPPGPVNVSNRIILSCEIGGGYPLAVINWQCEGSQPVSLESLMTNKSVSKVQLIVSTDRNGDICTCNASHPAWNQNRIDTIMFDVRYPPTSIPTITQIPNRPVIEGNIVNLTCMIVGGNPLATIVWDCTEFTIITPTVIASTKYAVSSIERNVTKDDNLKECICRGKHLLWTNEKEVRHTLNVYFKPTSTPSIIQTPSGPVNESDRINLCCEIQGGNPLANITWQCDGYEPVTSIGIPKTNTSVSYIQLTARQDLNGDNCTCNGSHPAWKQYQIATITFDVRYAPTSFPSITQKPKGPVIEGNNVTLSCRISGGNPLATIIWQCRGFTSGTQTDRSEDEVVSSIEGILTKDDNTRECICTGYHLLWTEDKKVTFRFDVYYPTTIRITNTQPIKLVQNKSMILVCEELDGNPKNASFKWYKDNEIIERISNFSIVGANANDTGNYTCQGSNGIGHKSATVEVHVLYPPRVSSLSAPYGNTVEENGTAILLCTVQSYPPPNIIVRKHGDNFTLQSNGNEFQRYFTIYHVTCFHTGSYICRATNIINGTEYSSIKHIELYVKCSPRQFDINEGSTNNIIGLALGENLTLSEHILAYPIVEVEWLFKQDKNSSLNSIQSAFVCSISNVFEHNICFIRLNLTETDFGLYTAVVVNDIGNATFTYTVTPQGPPYKSTNVIVSCGVQRVDISWLPGFNGGQEQTFYIIVSDKDGRERMYKTGMVGNKKDTLQTFSLKMPAGQFRFDIFGNNSFGNATVKGVPCEVQGLGENASVVGLAAGLGSGLAALVVIITVAVIVFRRKRITNKKEEETKIFMRSEKGIDEEDDDKLKDNPLYVTSDSISDGGIGPVYSVVDISKRTGSAQPSKFEVINKGPVYSEVKKTDKKVKNDRMPKKMKETSMKGQHINGIEMENVYGNSEKILQDNVEDFVYSNAECDSDRTNKSNEVYRPKKNKDGLIYADLDLDHSQSGTKFVIRGLENRTNYAIIDLNMKADPLPLDDDNNGEDEDDESEHQRNQNDV